MNRPDVRVSPRVRALSELALVAAGKLVALASLFAGGVLVARAGGPAEYGLFAAGLSLVLLLDATVGSPLDIATIRFCALHRDDPGRVDRFQAAAFRVKIGLGAAVLLAGWLVRRPLASALFGTEDHSGLLLVVLLSAVPLLLVRSTATCLQSTLRFRAYAMLDSAQGVLRLALVLLLLAAGTRAAEPLLGAYGISAALVFALGLWWLPQRYLTARWPQRDDARAIVGYSGAMTGIIILGTVTGRADIPILAAAGTAEETGYYAAAVQVSMVVTMLATYAGIVAQPRIIPLAREGRLGMLLRWNLLGAGAASAVMLPVAIWVFPVLIRRLFGDSYDASVPILRVLIVGTCADLLTMPVVMIFVMHLFPRTALVGEAVITLGFCAAVPIVLGAGAGAIGVAWIVTAIRLLKLLFYSWFTLRNMNRLPRGAAADWFMAPPPG